MIDHSHGLPITRQARLLGMSRGSVYYLPRPVSAADLALMRKLDELHLEHPFMGARMLRDQLARQGIHAGRRHIRTLMLKMGIEALAPQPGTSQAAPGHKIYPYLLRKLEIKRANQVWALDTTYIPMARGFVYLTAVVDVASRRVLAHKVAITLEAIHAREVIEQAFARYGTPEIVNTDQGSQFTAVEFTEVVLARGCKLSMDGRGAWRDNVFVERLWRSVKYERVYLKAYDSVSAARADIADYLDWYNICRPHSGLDRVTPHEKYLAVLPQMKVAVFEHGLYFLLELKKCRGVLFWKVSLKPFCARVVKPPLTVRPLALQKTSNALEFALSIQYRRLSVPMCGFHARSYPLAPSPFALIALRPPLASLGKHAAVDPPARL